MLAMMMGAKWALEPSFHQRMASVVLHRLSLGKAPIEAVADRATPRFVSLTGRDEKGKGDGWGPDKSAAVLGYEYLSKAGTKSGNVVVIPIMGTMSRYGDYCSWGCEDMANWVLEANRDETVSAIVLELNSPGGEVDGVEMFGAAVKQSQKPVVAWVAGMAASAAYWVASQADEIMLESETCSEVGSIGVLAMHVDQTLALEKEGYKVTIVRADGSESKALFNSFEPLSADVLAETKAALNPIRAQFIKTVKAGRPAIADAASDTSGVFSGKMYSGKQAIANGMADRIGYLGDAIRRADLLARKG
ncbi:S49 family peptidase [Fibrella aquatilis]|uniref:S49 family peptidase n=1 Tax=Fibrella aquatilis TaxID=2817059 RepID=A0A939K1V4_9BACT|nr:S49 family peptidase [Fibrella aquatilis]MBO0933908.1 S49 family peptidase [Fibrella aquatilis]